MSFSSELLPSSLQHVAIIMDGNGRWAQARRHARTFGHVRGMRVIREIVLEALRLKIAYLTLYAFSTENWHRPQHEVQLLLRLLSKYLRQSFSEFQKENICFRFIGDISQFSEKIQEQLQLLVQETQKNSGLNLTLALNYGGREELVRAIQKMLLLYKETEPTLTEEVVSSHLDTQGCPDPDLIIRTGGEQRLSNFLLWQASYSELYFTPMCWPDFNKEAFHKALESYACRTRRFGAFVGSSD